MTRTKKTGTVTIDELCLDPARITSAGFLLATGIETLQSVLMHWSTKFIALPLFGLTALGVAIGSSVDPVEREETPPDPLAGSRYACSEFIKQSLNDPSSVEWVSRLDWPTIQQEDGTVTVRAEYRAANAFGGMVREVTFCDITIEGDEIRLKQFR